MRGTAAQGYGGTEGHALVCSVPLCPRAAVPRPCLFDSPNWHVPCRADYGSGGTYGQYAPGVTVGKKEKEPTDPLVTPADAAAEALAELEAEDAARAAVERASGAAVVEPAPEAVQRLERELGEWRDRAMRTAADFENFRKRAAREREEAAQRGQTEVLARIVEVIDDLARVAHLDPANTTSQALHEGMLAIERKFLKTLELAGVERIDPVGQPFDPKSHEAVTTLPAPAAEQDHSVGAVFQHGYRFRGLLLRPARVAVLQWTPPAAADTGSDAGS